LIWDKHVDSEGKTTLAMEEYMAYRKQCAADAKLKNLKKQSEKAKKQKI